ncbi:MAG: cation transporter, partial [Pseudomonadota bacterium]|nr:cation transporter [Pseudomonadota bacterium]
SVIIVGSTWGLLRESVSLSLDAVPPGIDPVEVEAYLGALPGVTEVHDLHVWALSTTESALTVHLVRSDAHDDEALLRCIPEEVRARFGIGHATVQLETPESATACDLRPAEVV